MNVTRLLLALCLLAPAWAQQPQFPLREIVIEGAEHFEVDRIKRQTGLEVGQMVNEADFQKAIERLGDAGVFESIGYKFGPKDGGYSLTFTVQEVQQLYPVRLLNFDQSEEELYEELREEIPLFQRELPATGRMVDRIGDALQKRWLAAGNESKIIGQLTPIDEEGLAMVYQPEQRLQTIAFVVFQGSEVIEPLDLQRFFNPKAVGEPYSEARLRQLLHYNVRPLFEEKGHMGVEFCPCTAEPDTTSQGLKITVEVRDGPVYNYGQILRPNIPGIEEAKMDKLFPFEQGERVNMKEAMTAAGELDELLRENGFLKATTTYEREVNDEELTVALTFSTEPGARYTFRRLNIEGLDILAEPVIRKRWGLEEGQPFVASYPEFFLRRIEEERMFDNLAETRSSIQIDEAAKKVDVTIKFVGGQATEGPDPNAPGGSGAPPF